MNKSTIILVFGQVIGLASTVFMLFVFLNEAFLGRGVLYYEPNVAMATFEFCIASIGLVIQAIVVFFAVTPSTPSKVVAVSKVSKPKKDEERMGYETNNRRVYQ